MPQRGGGWWGRGTKGTSSNFHPHFAVQQQRDWQQYVWMTQQQKSNNLTLQAVGCGEETHIYV